MENLFVIGVTNAIIATALAAVAWLVTRILRQPPLVQVLWVLVLVKLVTPPLVALPWGIDRYIEKTRPSANTAAQADQLRVPQSVDASLGVDPHPAATDNAIATLESVMPTVDPIFTEETDHPRPAEQRQQNESTTSELQNWTTLVIAVWLAGSILWLLVAALRLARFHFALAHTTPCSDELQRLADEAAAALGVSCRYQLRMTDARLSPLVWPIGRPTILLSSPLLGELSRAETKTLLLHELVHLRRKDHWLRWLELLVTTLYWWHPVVWWARRTIQKAEEQACDAWVVGTLPDSAKDYASALFKTLQIVSDNCQNAPLIASQLGSAGSFKDRIEDIMNGTWQYRLPWSARLFVAAMALLILPLSLRAVRATEEDAAPPKTDASTEQDINATTDGTEVTKAETETIHPGMRVLIRVAGALPDQPLDDAYVVEPGGTVALGPAYGRARLEGLTIDEAEAALTKHLKTTLQDPLVQISIADRHSIRNSVDVPADPYHIAPGDVVHVTVANAFPDAPIADDFLVEPSGAIALGPQYGRAKVGGMTLEDAEREVVKQLKNVLDDPQVQVTLGGWRTRATSQRTDATATPSSTLVDLNLADIADITRDAQSAAKATGEVLDALREHVQFVDEQFKKIDALYRTGSRGGSADTRAMAGYELAAAQCELALAESHHDEAVAFADQAEKFAEEALKSVTAAYESGRRTHDGVLQAARNLSDSKRRVAQVRRPADSATSSGRSAPSQHSDVLRELTQLTSSSDTSSIGVLKKMADRRKAEYERLEQLVAQKVVTTAELDRAKSEYEVSVEQLRQAQRAVKYRKLLVELAESEYQQALDTNQQSPGAISNSELRRLKIMVELAKAKLDEIAE